jgi:Uma2 family endonuclease
MAQWIKTHPWKAMLNLSYDPLLRLPTAEELPHSDDTPVDNELQNDIPNFILNLLRLIWEERQDWFFGVDMAVHYKFGTPAIVPDGFLALGVPRYKSKGGRLSYLLWQEENVMPVLALEVISEEYNGEYEKKLEIYQSAGILYYAIYNPLTESKRKYKDRLSLEIYKLVDGNYRLIAANKQGIVWMSEIGFGMGCEVRLFATWEREWLYLYDEAGNRYLTANEVAQQERIAKQQAEAIAAQEYQEKLQERQEKLQERTAKEQAEIIAAQEHQEKLQERTAKEEAEALLKKYRDRFGDIPD